MRKDDKVRLRHMLDATREVLTVEPRAAPQVRRSEPRSLHCRDIICAVPRNKSARPAGLEWNNKAVLS